MARKKDCDSEPLNGAIPQDRSAISNKKPRAQARDPVDTPPCNKNPHSHLSGDFFVLTIRHIDLFS
ncbi:hypothetical protein VCHA30O60_70078 [Vibrio chagasii]|nr:hypothetical protein VCHA30O60_70078 [Vibrio chagasii]